MNTSGTIDNLSNYISDGCFYEIIIIGKLKCDSSKGRFFRGFQIEATRHKLFFSNEALLPAFIYTYIKQNHYDMCSWLNYIYMSSVYILYSQEVITLKGDRHLLRKNSNEFQVYYVPGRHLSSHNGDERPVEGLAAFYQKSLKVLIKPVTMTFRY